MVYTSTIFSGTTFSLCTSWVFTTIFTCYICTSFEIFSATSERAHKLLSLLVSVPRTRNSWCQNGKKRYCIIYTKNTNVFPYFHGFGLCIPMQVGHFCISRRPSTVPLTWISCSVCVFWSPKIFTMRGPSVLYLVLYGIWNVFSWSPTNNSFFVIRSMDFMPHWVSPVISISVSCLAQFLSH